jgi:hypothetical protein
MNYETTTHQLSDFLFSIVPPFDLSRIERVSPLCRKQSEKYVTDLKRFKLWALKSTLNVASILDLHFFLLQCTTLRLNFPRVF